MIARVWHGEWMPHIYKSVISEIVYMDLEDFGRFGGEKYIWRGRLENHIYENTLFQKKIAAHIYTIFKMRELYIPLRFILTKIGQKAYIQF